MYRWMGLAGVVGGISWILLQSVFGAEWGTPGTTAYSLYELFNRLWLLPLVLMGLGFVAVDQVQRQRYPQFSRLPIIVIIVGFTAMIVGNVAEFWFFTDYPYGVMNARSYAWITFLLGLLIELVGLVLLGRATLRAGVLPKWCGILLLIALPLEIVVFFTIQMMLLFTAVVATILGVQIFWTRRDEATLTNSQSPT